MSCVAEFTFQPESIPFGETLVENPGMWIEIERIVPTKESALPFFWVWGSDPEQFLEAAERESQIEATRLLERVENGALFRAEWSLDAGVVIDLEQLDVTILEAEGTADRWRFEVRAQDRRELFEFQRVFRAQSIPITLNRISDLKEVVEESQQSLTAVQRETLITAYREGYFDDPREVTQRDLGEYFEISRRAISDRLRRGIRNLIASTLVPGAEE